MPNNAVFCFILFDFQVAAPPVSDAVPQNAAAHIAPALQQVLVICRFSFFLNCLMQVNSEMHSMHQIVHVPILL